MNEHFKQILLNEAKDLLEGTPSMDDIDIAISLLRVLSKILWKEVSKQQKAHR